VEESEQEEEPISQGKIIKPLVEALHHAQGLNEGGSSHVEGKLSDGSREGSGEEAEKADSEGHEAEDSESNRIDLVGGSGKKAAASSDSGDAEISDDEPLVIPF